MLLILQYHHISKGLELNPGICPGTVLEKHLRDLKHWGFGNFEFDALDSEMFARVHKAVLFTFDDGYKSVLHKAFPLLSKYGYKGAVFAVSGFLGKYSNWEVPFLPPLPHLDKNDLRFLYSQGWIIGSHSHTHKDLTQLPEKELRDEIITSKQALEDVIGAEVECFSYPYGKYNGRVKLVLMESGFRYAFKSSGFPKLPLNLLEIPRHSVYLIDISLRYKIDAFYTRFETIKAMISNGMAWLSPIYIRISQILKGHPGDED